MCVCERVCAPVQEKGRLIRMWAEVEKKMKSNRYREYVAQRDNEINPCDSARLIWKK